MQFEFTKYNLYVRVKFMVIDMDLQEQILKEMYDVRESGLYSIASLDMFNILDKLDISDKLHSHLEYTNSLLFE